MHDHCTASERCRQRQSCRERLYRFEMDVEHWRALIRELRGIEIIDLMRVRVEQVEDIELQVPKTADVQHLADHVIAERGVRYGRVVMIPTSTDKKPKARKHGHHHD